MILVFFLVTHKIIMILLCPKNSKGIFMERKKEVIQPQVPLRLPCDDLAHLTEPRFSLIKELGFT